LAIVVALDFGEWLGLKVNGSALSCISTWS
jgi:hypothetical protein